MSGLEVVGVVLGTLPLIISALEHYQGGLNKVTTWRSYTKVLQNVSIRLQTEQSLLQNNCEILVGSVVPSNQVEDMMADPFGKLWQDDAIQKQLRLKLHSSLPIFEKNVEQMKSIIDILNEELVDHTENFIQGGVANKGLIKRQLKRIAFTLRKPEYEDHIKQLSERNSQLERLLKSYAKLATRKNSRSQSKVFGFLQAMTRNIHRAIRSGFSCGCADSHSLNLQLIVPSSIPQNYSDALAKALDVHITLSYDLKDIKGKGKTNDSWTWDEIAMRLVTAAAGAQPKPLQRSAALMTQPKNFRKSRRVAFAQTFGQIINQGQGTKSVTMTKTVSLATLSCLPPSTLSTSTLSTPNAPDLTDLCGTLAQKQPLTKGGYIGKVIDVTATEHNEFEVFSINSCDDRDNWSAISLKDLLQSGALQDRDKGPNLPQLLNLAATVASSLLQLHDTPWIPDRLTSDNLYLFQRDGALDYDRIYVTRHLLPSVPPSAVPSTRAIKNLEVFSLGVLLIELILCEPLSSLCPGENEQSQGYTRTHPLLVKSTVEDILYQVECAASDRYSDAVSSCLKCNFDCTNYSLDDAEFRDQVYSYVVGPLHSGAMMTR
ncbi:hypothetical protein F4778DRAFT_138768 [Xylariomycetidae sp. FL2044]|nr:hypothetical protein F4778DRAFT_138768 [Xylariomycetidae sp. FL2044]